FAAVLLLTWPEPRQERISKAFPLRWVGVERRRSLVTGESGSAMPILRCGLIGASESDSCGSGKPHSEAGITHRSFLSARIRTRFDRIGRSVLQATLRLNLI